MKKGFLFFLGVMFISVLVHAQKDSTLQQFTGHYVFPAGSQTPDATISLDGSSMYISSTIGSATLSRVAGDTFNIVEYNGSAIFKRNDKGSVSGVHIVVADLDLEGTKDEQALWLWRPNLLFKQP